MGESKEKTKPKITGITSVSGKANTFCISGTDFTKDVVAFNGNFSNFTYAGCTASNSQVCITVSSVPPSGATVSVDGSDPYPWPAQTGKP